MQRILLGTAALAATLAAASTASAQFFATQSDMGAIAVVDAAGSPITVATGDPVGQRPELCPPGAYYVVELPTDTSQLALADCDTGQGQYSVEFGNSAPAAAQ